MTIATVRAAETTVRAIETLALFPCQYLMESVLG
jgi:hypothetical protein